MEQVEQKAGTLKDRPTTANEIRAVAALFLLERLLVSKKVGIILSLSFSVS